MDEEALQAKLFAIGLLKMDRARQLVDDGRWRRERVAVMGEDWSEAQSMIESAFGDEEEGEDGGVRADRPFVPVGPILFSAA